MQSDKLQKHMLAVYLSLRIGIAVIAFAFPLFLWIGGAFKGIKVQDSLSAYYHAAAHGQSMRDWFVGILFAAGPVLYLYKGFSRHEDWALNLAGICAIAIAEYPMPWDCGTTCGAITVHDVVTVSFFLCVAYVCFFCSADTLSMLNDAQRARQFHTLYRVSGMALIASPLTALFLTLVFPQFKSHAYLAEVAGVWAFAAYWFLKSYELHLTKAEQVVLSGRFQT